MYLSTRASRIRQLEAENARKNRLDIVKALSHGQITRRDLFKWGIFTTAGTLAYKNGLSPYAPSAYAQVPTGAPRSPLFNARKFTQKLPRPVLQKPINMVPVANHEYAFNTPGGQLIEPPARERSYHDLFNQYPNDPAYRNPVTNIGPREGRPPGEFFAHQRWNESDFHPVKGYLLSLGQVKGNSKFHPNMPAQDANSVWSFGERPAGHRGSATGSQLGSAVPLLLQMRYYEPVICRIYNDLPVNRTSNNGFGRNEISTHFHNAHNGAESDGACNAYHFPGTFYDYHWKGACARHDMPDIRETAAPRYADRCSAPNDTGGLTLAQGDFRELQGSMWFHDHRFFFTAENVHKGNFSLANMYSGPDRGCDTVEDGINLRLPSGNLNGKSWGNLDFDVNLAISNPAFDQNGQLFFDIFDTDGFLGDVLAVNGAYAPYMEVLPRRYRFRTLNASMARFIKLCLSVEFSTRFPRATKVPVYVVANDGNFLVRPVRLTDLDVQGVAERFDFVVDFSQFSPGDLINLVNVMRQVDGRKPDRALTLAEALRGDTTDPTVGPIMQFKVVNSLQSYDDPTVTYDASKKTIAHNVDNSANLGAGGWINGTNKLTWQIPIVQPNRVRTIEFGRSGSGDSRDNPGGQCIPECGDIEAFPWTIKINGQAAHSLNANRISALIPKPGEVEHWVLVNGGGGWDHPIHLHHEEAVTIDRAGDPVHPTERLARKDVWRLGTSGKRTVRIQVRFGEFGGAYVAHCHNTTHEDFAMLMRYQLLSAPGTPQSVPTQTPIPSPQGITWKTPEILLEGDPRPRLASR
jgi:FtsP/CotA-like multicopper oxidase with cupredoxin domain